MSRIAQYVAENITNTIEYLLGRFVGATMTLCPDEFRIASTARRVWRNSWPDDFRESVNVVRKYRKDSGTKVAWFNTTHDNYIPVQVGDDVYTLHVVTDDGGMLYFDHQVPVPIERLGLSNVDAFMQWIVRTDEVARRLDTSSKTLMDLLEMANTPGQLHRMAPDLVRYLPKGMQTDVDQQQSKSRLPQAWSTYRRSKVRTLCDTLAMCYLLPATYQIHAPRHHGLATSATWQVLPWATKVDWDTTVRPEQRWRPKIMRPFEVTPTWASEVPS